MKSVFTEPDETERAGTNEAQKALSSTMTDLSASSAKPPHEPSYGLPIRIDQQVIVFGLFVLLFVAFSSTLPGFLSIANVLTLMKTVSVLGILGLGMAVVVIGRGIDLSMIAVLAVPPALVLTLASNGHALALALSAGVLLAVGFGCLNGVLVAYAEIPSLFTTLATGIGLAGIGQSGIFAYEIVPWPPQLKSLEWLGRGALMGVPYPVIAFAASALAIGLFMRKTTPGLFIYAVGDNPATARISGIPVRPIVVLQYAISALVALVAGLVLSASSGNMDTRIFNLTWIYDVILVVVLGGIGLAGGRGGALNVVVGTLLIGTLVNGMTILNVSYEVQNLIKGLVLLSAIALDSILNPRNEETAQQGDI